MTFLVHLREPSSTKDQKQIFILCISSALQVERAAGSSSDLYKTIPIAPGFFHLVCQTRSAARFKGQGPTALRAQIKQQSQNHQLTSPKYLQPKSLLSQGLTV